MEGISSQLIDRKVSQPLRGLTRVEGKIPSLLATLGAPTLERDLKGIDVSWIIGDTTIRGGADSTVQQFDAALSGLLDGTTYTPSQVRAIVHQGGIGALQTEAQTLVCSDPCTAMVELQGLKRTWTISRTGDDIQIDLEITGRVMEKETDTGERITGHLDLLLSDGNANIRIEQFKPEEVGTHSSWLPNRKSIPNYIGLAGLAVAAIGAAGITAGALVLIVPSLALPVAPVYVGIFIGISAGVAAIGLYTHARRKHIYFPVGVWRNERAHAKKRNLYDKVAPNLYLGALPLAKDAAKYTQFTHILAMTEKWELDEGTFVHPLQSLDSKRTVLETPDHTPVSPDLIEEGVKDLMNTAGKDKPTLVHCKSGKGRSATVAAAYLCRTQGLTWQQALTTLRQHRSAVSVHSLQQKTLAAWYAKHEIPLRAPLRTS